MQFHRDNRVKDKQIAIENITQIDRLMRHIMMMNRLIPEERVTTSSFKDDDEKKK